MLIAASTEPAFRSGIFCSAIFCTCSRVILATFFLLGSPEADSMPQAFLMRTAAGGVKAKHARVFTSPESAYQSLMKAVSGEGL